MVKMRHPWRVNHEPGRLTNHEQQIDPSALESSLVIEIMSETSPSPVASVRTDMDEKFIRTIRCNGFVPNTAEDI